MTTVSVHELSNRYTYSSICRYTYTSDERFRAIHKIMSEDYLLQILPVKVGETVDNISRLNKIQMHRSVFALAVKR